MSDVQKMIESGRLTIISEKELGGVSYLGRYRFGDFDIRVMGLLDKSSSIAFNATHRYFSNLEVAEDAITFERTFVDSKEFDRFDKAVAEAKELSALVKPICDRVRVRIAELLDNRK